MVARITKTPLTQAGRDPQGYTIPKKSLSSECVIVYNVPRYSFRGGRGIDLCIGLRHVRESDTQVRSEAAYEILDAASSFSAIAGDDGE
jgi:hypothetical protein